MAKLYVAQPRRVAASDGAAHKVGAGITAKGEAACNALHPWNPPRVGFAASYCRAQRHPAAVDAPAADTPAAPLSLRPTGAASARGGSASEMTAAETFPPACRCPRSSLRATSSCATTASVWRYCHQCVARW
jgi:hypothetical protein